MLFLSYFDGGADFGRDRFYLIRRAALEHVRYLYENFVGGARGISADNELFGITEPPELNFERHAGVELVRYFHAVYNYVGAIGVKVDIRENFFARTV